MTVEPSGAGDQPTPKKDAPKPATAMEQGVGCMVMLGLMALIVFGVKSCFFSGEDRKQEEPSSVSASAEAMPSTTVAPPAPPSGPSDTVVMAGAMSAVKRKLVDPNSAQFRNVRAYRQSSGTTAVCGEVNAKNRAGGYNGYERFVSAGTDQYTYLESEVNGMSEVWSTLCR